MASWFRATCPRCGDILEPGAIWCFECNASVLHKGPTMRDIRRWLSALQRDDERADRDEHRPDLDDDGPSGRGGFLDSGTREDVEFAGQVGQPFGDFIDLLAVPADDGGGRFELMGAFAHPRHLRLDSVDAGSVHGSELVQLAVGSGVAVIGHPYSRHAPAAKLAS